jgi:SM-20-related protein
MSLRYLDMEAFRETPRASEPFEYLVVPGFVRSDACARINADYPTITERGSFPVAQLAFGPAFQEFLDELESDEFRAAFEQKFDIDLTGRPTTVTVRGRCSPKDGQIHTDSLSKIITVLI